MASIAGIPEIASAHDVVAMLERHHSPAEAKDLALGSDPELVARELEEDELNARLDALDTLEASENLYPYYSYSD